MRCNGVNINNRLSLYKVFSLVCCFCLLIKANGQIQLGARLSVNLAKITSDNYSTPFRPGISSGVFVENHTKSRMIFLSGIGYSLKGCASNPGNINLKYITGNILLGYDFTSRFSVLVGPEFGYLLRVYYKNGDYRVYGTETYRKFDVGVQSEVRYKISKKTGIIYSYVHGLRGIQKPVVHFSNGTATVNKENNPRNRVHQFGMFFLFKT